MAAPSPSRPLPSQPHASLPETMHPARGPSAWIPWVVVVVKGVVCEAGQGRARQGVVCEAGQGRQGEGGAGWRWQGRVTLWSGRAVLTHSLPPADPTCCLPHSLFARSSLPSLAAPCPSCRPGAAQRSAPPRPACPRPAGKG